MSPTVRAWALACRPRTLSAAVVPVAVGTACAASAGGFRPGPAAAALFGALMIQLGTNFANDVFDFEKGADTGARLGPTRVTQAGLLRPAQVKAGIAVAFALAMAAGVYLTVVAGPAIVVIGLASLAAGLAYTGGPFPLGYHGLGDVLVLAFFGFVAVCGTAFVQVGRVPPLALVASIPVGALATAILVVNNLRDRSTDVLAGKRTLAVRLGRRAGELEYRALVAAAFVAPPALYAAGLASPWALLPLASLPLAVGEARALRAARDGDGPAWNRRLAGTARLLAVHGLLLAAGIAAT